MIYNICKSTSILEWLSLTIELTFKTGNSNASAVVGFEQPQLEK